MPRIRCDRRLLPLACAALFGGALQGCGDPATQVAGRPGGAVAPGGAKSLTDVAFAAARDRLAWSEAALLCRIEPEMPVPGEARVMFTAIGPAANERCDSVYDPTADRLYRFLTPTRFVSRFGRLALDLPGDARISVEIVDHFLRDARGFEQFEGRALGERFERAPSGWTSQLYYRGELSESAILENANWIAAHLAPFGARTILIDDGWQGGASDAGPRRDWESTARGMRAGPKYLAEAIHDLGLQAGLWIVPHGQSDPAVAQRDGDAFLWRADGSSVGQSAVHPDDPNQQHWLGRYILDTSGPSGQAYLRRLFERVAGEWGFDYFRLDGQPLVQQVYSAYADRFGTPGVSARDAYRAGLRVIRDTIGPDRYLSAGWGVPRWAAGICDGGRTGADTAASWEGIQPALEATWQSYWTHNLLWQADPGAFCVGPPLTPDQARLWASLLGLTGHAAFVGDPVTELPEDRVELLRRILPSADIRPMQLCPIEQPDVICLKIDDRAGRRDIVGLFNWSDAPTQVRLDAPLLGLPAGDYLVYDVWERRLLGTLRDGAVFTLAPTSCGVLCIRQIERDRPTLIGTSRHITQGAVDVVQYDGGGQRLRGVSRLVGGDPYETRFFLEPGGLRFSLLDARATGASVELRVEDSVGVLTLRSDESREVNWSVVYAVSGE